MKIKIFIAQVEVQRRLGSKMPSDVTLAYVNCFIPALNGNAAISKLNKALREDRYELNSIRFLMPFGHRDLGWRKNSKEDMKLVRQAEKTGQLVYGVFNCWRPDKKNKKKQ